MSHRSLHLHLDAYLRVREALGFQMRAERTLLRDFVGFVEAHGNGGPIRAHLAVDWACTSSAQRGRGGAAQRLSMARRFLTSLRAPLSATEIPPSGLVASFRRPPPYLFTPPQIAVLIRAAHAMGPPGALRPHTCATFLGVLASTGLRVGEAIRLSVQDVHLEATPPVLHIRQTKFHKSRWVPLHPTTVVPLRRYSAMRTTLGYAALSDVFFVSEQGGSLTHGLLRRWFLAVCHTASVGPTAEGRRPSLRAVRHSFAVQRMRLWYQEGRDVQGLLPHLSVYLGHVRPQESYWYLTATPELLAAAAERFRAYAAAGGTP
jgi:integrase/recombinase XerD